MQEVDEHDFTQPGAVFQMGVAPVRIDILTELTGLLFADAWATRVSGTFGDLDVDFIGKDAFIANKRAIGRAKDISDIEGL
jgi:hypothetical protein